MKSFSKSCEGWAYVVNLDDYKVKETHQITLYANDKYKINKIYTKKYKKKTKINAKKFLYWPVVN